MAIIRWRLLKICGNSCRRILPKTVEDIDGVSFRRRVTSLVDIDNAIRSSQLNSSTANSPSEANQVDPRVLKKTLEECTDATSPVYRITALPSIVGVVAILGNAVSIISLERRSFIEGTRIQIHKWIKSEILSQGVAFELNEITAKHSFFKILRATPCIWIHFIIIVAMLLSSYSSAKALQSVISFRESALAEAASAPAPSAPVPSGTSPGKTWCVAKAGSPDIGLMNGLNFACGEGGVDCGPIQAEGACFSPDTIVSHASFAYNSYYQNMGRNPSNCYFGGISIVTITTPVTWDAAIFEKSDM